MASASGEAHAWGEEPLDEPLLVDDSPWVSASSSRTFFSSMASFSRSFCVRLFCFLSSNSHSSARFILMHCLQTGRVPSHFCSGDRQSTTAAPGCMN